MKDLSSDRLEHLFRYLNPDIKEFEDTINHMGLFDYDGIDGTDIIHEFRKFTSELREQNYYASNRFSAKFQNVWETEDRCSNTLREVTEQLKSYNQYVQGLSNVMQKRTCMSVDDTRKNVKGLFQQVIKSEAAGSETITRRLYPGLIAPSLHDIELQNKIKRLTNVVVNYPHIIAFLGRSIKQFYIKTFEKLYKEATRLAQPFVTVLDEYIADWSIVIEDIKMCIYSQVDVSQAANPWIYEFKESMSQDEIDALIAKLEEAGVPADFTVDKVVVLNQQSGALGFGHNALMLIGEDGSGLFYSYGGEFPDEAFSIAMGNDSDFHMDRMYLEADRVETFFTNSDDSGYIIPENKDGEDPYNRGTVIDITNEEGWQMIAEAETIRDNPDEKYNLYSNNCQQTASQVLLAGDVHYAMPSGKTLYQRLEGLYEHFEAWKSVINPDSFLGADNSELDAGLFFKFVLIDGYDEAKNDGTMPNKTYENEAETGEELGWISGTLDEIYEEISNE